MPNRKDYPREAAHTVRQGRRALAELALSRAVAALEEARGDVENAARALQQLLAELPNDAPGTGVTSALLLQRAASFAARQADEVRRLRSLLRQAQARQSAMQAELALGQQKLAEAHAEEQVLARDRERFGVAQRLASERAEELEGEEQRDAVRPRPGR